YNIERTDENHYRISLAVAGFAEDELSVEVRENVLTVQGRHEGKAEADETHYLYKGIAARSFERRFQIAENVEVGGAALANGLLHVDLERIVPEEKKLRQIPISADLRSKNKVIDAKAKAA
ncbi:MAG: Hsp20 family protein, partial [Alphaproteobacteria bacterium]